MNIPARRVTQFSAVALRVASALIAGFLLFLSFPPRPLWFLAPLGVALAVWTILTPETPRLRSGFGYGYLTGLGFLLPLLPWVGEFVGPGPWLALAGFEALFVGLFGVLVVAVHRLAWAPLWIASAWVSTEWLRSNVPFGGFPWGRLAFGQPDSWLTPLASLGGAPLLSFGVALTGAGVAWLVRSKGQNRTAVIGAVTAILVAPTVGLAMMALQPDPNSGVDRVVVAAIQGSVPRLGLDFNAQRKQVLDNHVQRTLELAADIEAGRQQQPDIVVWPENSSDIDPLRNADAAADISAAARAVRAPILVGGVLVNEPDVDGPDEDGTRTTTNSVLVWDPESGPGERHDKRIIQPFGEYLPYREFFAHFSSYADRAGNFVPGDGDGTVTAAGVRIGVATCYEVAFDRAFADSIRSGATLLTVPTNNATFGDTEMTYQQLAMSRIRAVEHGRAVVIAATSGVSAMIAADGTVIDQTDLFVPAAMVADLPLREGITLASRLGAWPEYILCFVTLGAVLTALSLNMSARRQ